MRKSERLAGQPSLRYDIFNDSGRRVYKGAMMSGDGKDAPDGVSTKGIKVEAAEDTDSRINSAHLKMMSIAGDVLDYIEENPVHDIESSKSDLDFAVKRMEDMRSQFRTCYLELKSYRQEEDDDEHIERNTKKMKDYILEAKAALKAIRTGDDQQAKEDLSSKKKAFNFLHTDALRILTELEGELTVEETASDDEVIRRTKDLPTIEKKIAHLGEKVRPVITSSMATAATVADIKGRYDAIFTAKTKYFDTLQQMKTKRELDKEQKFKESSLSISLPKFKGYGAAMDVYTFKRTFDKLYSKQLPKRMMPDMLKNNYLVGTALHLVKGIDDVDEIWDRLVSAFGDPKIMLSKKLDSINDLEQIWKMKGSEKVISALQRIVNVMKDLTELSKEHNIENDLYYGDGLERIMKLLGEKRSMEWIKETCDSKLTSQQSWDSVIKFLEKEAKILQHKINVLGKEDSYEKPRSKDESKVNPVLRKEHAHYSGGSTDNSRDSVNLNCYICGESGHVATFGPGRKKVIQYFSCPLFAGYTCSERMEILRKKGFCFQCLLPGADGKNGKHAEGKCQREFTCKHLSHQRHKMKKHVLVCEEHKDSAENQTLLENYRQRCIIKNPDVQNFSKEIKLSFYNAPSSIESRSAVADSAGAPSSNVSSSVASVEPACSPSANPPAASVSPNADMNPARPPGAIASCESVPSGLGVNSASCTLTASAPNAITSTVNSTSSISTSSINSTIVAEPTLGPVMNNASADQLHASTSYKTTHVVNDDAIYQLQLIKVDGKDFLLFYDSGCGNFVSRMEAVQKIGRRAALEHPGPTPLGGVGNITTESPHGVYSIDLPTYDGDNVRFTGVCLDDITGVLPTLPLGGQIEQDIIREFQKAGYDPKDLPKLPSAIGGAVDFMIGIKYARYCPKQIFQLPCGLTISESVFRNADGGGRGVLSGPHPVFTMIARHYYNQHSALRVFLTNQLKLCHLPYYVNPDITLLGYKDPRAIGGNFYSVGDSLHAHRSREAERFECVELSGTQILFRCISCRGCKACRYGDRTDAISLREEIEDDLITKCVVVNLETKTTSHKLPLIADPEKRLAPNRDRAMKVYLQQVKKLNKSPEERKAVLESEKKLQDLGFVDWVENLSSDDQKLLRNSPIKNYLPWRCVYKEDSVSTPVRLVFDASQPTATGYALNDVVAKGTNTLNPLLEIVIRWGLHSVAVHTDIAKMYNCIELVKEHWCYQRYLFEESLNPNNPAKDKFVKTAIYGVRSSGNVATHALRETARLLKDKYPDAYRVVMQDIYADDTLSGAPTPKKACALADDLEALVSGGGFSFKAIAFSGQKPPESMSSDGESINVAGFRWFSEKDRVSLNIKENNFEKKHRGRKPKLTSKGIPEKLNRTHCTSPVHGVFDLVGRVAPLLAEMKLDLHDLAKMKLNWQDSLPDNLRPLWESHFEMIQELKTLRYNRAIVPEDAVSLNLDTVDFGDSSGRLLCVAIYARFLRKNGKYSSQLVLARTRLIPDDMSIPRGELYAALINASCGETVRRAFGSHHQGHIKISDSMVALHWICNMDIPLKQWARNRVLETRRLTNVEDWRYLESKKNLADIGTRRGRTLKDVGPESKWINGSEWMKEDSASFPVKSAKELCLGAEDVDEIKKEISYTYGFDEASIAMYYNCALVTRTVPEEVKERYSYSQYIIDPNKHDFKHVVRVVGYMLRFVNNCKRKIKSRKSQGDSTVLARAVPDMTQSSSIDPVSEMIIEQEEEYQQAERYFFQKASLEIKQFLKKEDYGKISRDDNGILMYTGRILPSQPINAVTTMTEAMKDLCSTSFYVPVIDRHSPVAYSIAMHFHWNYKTVLHSGIETVLRKISTYVHIIGGRDLVRMIKKRCKRCRYLYKRMIEASMGSVSAHNMNIAPAFYITQVDVAGSFKSYSPANKRETVKVWFTIFCCATTGTLAIKLMEDYSSSSFVQAFIRLSCDVGYPKLLLVDGGSQLVSSCENMRLSFTDIKSQLYHDVQTQYEVCPVGGHNMHGRVERKIREVRQSIEKLAPNTRLSLMHWETLAADIANRINDLPMALGNQTTGFEYMDLLTPNRLKLGRNNDRSPIGCLTITNDAERIIEDNRKIFNTWFETWLTSHVPKLMHQPKWFRTDVDVRVGDIVLFLKNDSVLCQTYQYGMIVRTHPSTDGLIRKVDVKYRNHNEETDRETFRSVRDLVIIHHVDELDLTQELAEMYELADSTLRDAGRSNVSTDKQPPSSCGAV